MTVNLPGFSRRFIPQDKTINLCPAAKSGLATIFSPQ